MARYGYFVTRTAQRDLKRIDIAQRQRIGRKLRYYIENDDPLVYAVQLTGIKPPMYRFRVGKYRIFFDVKGSVIRILSVSLRDKAYLD